MTGLLIFFCILLIGIVVVQLGRLTELAVRIRGEGAAQIATNDFNAKFGLFFMVVFLVGCLWSSAYYKDSILGYGPHTAASEHGVWLDDAFHITLLVTGIVFFLTQIALFWFAYKYRGRENRVAFFQPHDTRLEIIWTAIPALAMFYLVADGLVTWNKAMADIPEPWIIGEDYMEIEATGYQFAWDIRYPGPDGVLGARNFRKISGTNPLGQEWEDIENLDDQHVTEIVLPVGKPVRVRITAKDVLHNFYLPHFRVKMDAVPGIPTYFVFTPTTTTDEYRERLGELDRNGEPLYPEWHDPYDPAEPDGPKRYEAFNYELACAELCGKGHYSMKRTVRIVSQDEYDDWIAQQPSYYLQSVRGKDADPFKDKLLDFEIKNRRTEFNDNFNKALSSDIDKIIRLKYVNFETGSATLTPLSRYELDNVVAAMNKYPNLTLEVGGHTDSTGDAAKNLSLSDARANAVKSYLTSKGANADRLSALGFGPDRPIDTNDTAEGRANNRRTELRILTQ